jgi:hypothetical protein
MKTNIQKIALFVSILILAIAQTSFAQQAPAATKTTAAKPAAEKTPAAAPKDKEVGKDEKGRTIYEGPKGGRYYMNNGKKVYIKKTADDKAAPAKTAPAKEAPAKAAPAKTAPAKK